MASSLALAARWPHRGRIVSSAVPKLAGRTRVRPMRRRLTAAPTEGRAPLWCWSSGRPSSCRDVAPAADPMPAVTLPTR